MIYQIIIIYFSYNYLQLIILDRLSFLYYIYFWSINDFDQKFNW